MKKNSGILLIIIGLLFFNIKLEAQSLGKLWGTIFEEGIPNAGGILFYYDPTTGKDSIVYTFPSANENSSNLIQASDGNIYGVTTDFGPNGSASGGNGTIFKCTPSGTVSTLVTFPGTVNTINPICIIQGSDGNFYGMVSGNALQKNYGSIFKCTLSGILTTLVNFDSIHGSYPGYLIQGKNGNLYGVTGGGGTYNQGIIFQCTMAGTLTTLFSFPADSKNNIDPLSIMQAKDGNFYGITENGGSANTGTLFKCDTLGNLTTLVNFTGAANGSYPMGNLIQDTNGDLYGTASGTFTSPTAGTLFKCTTSGTLTTLVNFKDTNGSNPQAGVIQGSDGNLYGTTGNDGTSHMGTLFKYTLNGGNQTTLVNFPYNNPETTLRCQLLEIKNSATGIESIKTENNDLTFYPNPSHGVFTFMEHGVKDKVNLEIYNMFGKNIYNTQCNTGATQIDLSGRPTGVYLYRMVNENGETIGSGKLIIE